MKKSYLFIPFVCIFCAGCNHPSYSKDKKIPDVKSELEKIKAKPVEIKEVRASSISSEKYSAGNVASHSWASWVEGSSSNGEGEWIELIFEESTSLDGITIKNGFGNLAYYWKNNRVKSGKIYLDDETTFITFTLEDTPLPTYVSIRKNYKTFEKMKIVIDEVYEGTGTDNDLCIDEIAVNAGINRTEIYGAYYEDGDISYVYDPETKRMLKGLYEIDVGKDNVRDKGTGNIEVRAMDWETGEKYWTSPNASFSGTMFHDFFPGTGGGHRYYLYHIYPNPEGRHILATYRSEYGGIPEVHDPKLRIYVWENSKWKEISDSWNEKPLKRVWEFKRLLDSRNLKYNFYINSDLEEAGSFIFDVTFTANPYFHVSMEFPFADYEFKDYKKSLSSVAAFGTLEEVKQNPVLKEFVEKGQQKNIVDSPVAYAAAFNPDPQVTNFLIDQGFDYLLLHEYEHSISALEAWNLGKNSEKVRDVLVAAGASYSPEMLVNSFKQRDLNSFKELLPLVKDKSPLILAMTYEIDRSAGNIKPFIIALKENGDDMDILVENEKGQPERSLVNSAIGSSNLDLLKFLVYLGCKIPEYSYVYSGETPLYQCADIYIDSCNSADHYLADNDSFYEKKTRTTATNARAMIDYLFAHGCKASDLNRSGGTILHGVARSGHTINKYDLEMAKLFIEKGVDVNAINKSGEHALGIIVKEMNRESREYYKEEYNPYAKQFLNLLLSSGAQPEYGLLQYCLDFNESYKRENKNYDGFKEWLSRCTGKNILKKYNDTSMECSIITVLFEELHGGGELEFADHLLSNGFTLDGKIYYNGLKSPLFYFVDVNGYGEISDEFIYYLELLLKHEKDVNGVYSGRTAFFFMAMNCFDNADYIALEKLIKLFFLYGADWSINSSDMWHEKTHNVAEILLLEKKSNFTKRNFTEENINSYVNCAKLLIEHGAGDVLTPKAFKKAKVSEKLYLPIFAE